MKTIATLRSALLTISLTALVQASGSVTVQAQEFESKVVELGVDAEFTRTAFDGGPLMVEAVETTIRIPGRFRVGVFLSQRLELESAISLTAIKRGKQTATVFTSTFGLTGHLNDGYNGRVGFVQPFIALDYANFSGDTAQEISGPQFGVGVGLGYKAITRSQFAARFEGFALRKFASSEFRAATVIGFRIGLSFLVR
ncbi:MAG: hypothetical protein ACE5GA_04925 [Candidatus Zixiibacteriota bacterium]